jgi:ubiquinol-cytochrome c reductase cytochrome c subunit
VLLRVLRQAATPAGVVVAAAALAMVLYPPHGRGAGAQGGGSTGRLAAPALVDKTSPSRSAQLALGRTLFDENCSSCHGIDAQGSKLGLDLRGVGAAVVDLWVSSGWMPLAQPTIEPIRKPSKFDRQQTEAIANYVASLAPGGLPIPKVDLKGANAAEGFSVFALNCAPCHTITGAGDALSSELSAPPLHGLTPTQVAEAVRTGPGTMPTFNSFVISKQQLVDVVDYVTRHIEHPDSPGGLSLGGVGPVAEGFVGLFVGVGACVLIALWIGERDRHEGHGGGHGGGQGGGEPAGPGERLAVGAAQGGVPVAVQSSGEGGVDA